MCELKKILTCFRCLEELSLFVGHTTKILGVKWSYVCNLHSNHSGGTTRERKKEAIVGKYQRLVNQLLIVLF